MKQPEPFSALIALLARLPGIGRRSAERIAYSLVRNRKNMAGALANALREVDQQVMLCSRCGNLTHTSEDPCALCTDTRRNGRVLCVVEEPADIMRFEGAGGYEGRYHALMGKISPMQGEDLSSETVAKLLRRIEEEKIEEVILAFGTDVESDASASYLHEVLSRRKVRVSRLAYGLPAGSGVEYTDPVTLARALKGRQPV